jgi:glycosyltransferase involved in cell wall biosynthesis
LVFTGSTWHRDSEVVEAISRAGLAERVRHLGQVPRSHLKGIYENAVALVYPSLFEGFGGPVLEAMTLGCPVIASNATSIPEVAGDAAILLSPDDVRGWVGAMTKVLEDDHLRTDLITKGRQRAREFSWETSTSRLIEAYERVLS